MAARGVRPKVMVELKVRRRRSCSRPMQLPSCLDRRGMKWKTAAIVFTERSLLPTTSPFLTARSATGSGATNCPATSSAPRDGSTPPTSRASSLANEHRISRVADVEVEGIALKDWPMRELRRRQRPKGEEEAETDPRLQLRGDAPLRKGHRPLRGDGPRLHRLRPPARGGAAAAPRRLRRRDAPGPPHGP